MKKLNNKGVISGVAALLVYGFSVIVFIAGVGKVTGKTSIRELANAPHVDQCIDCPKHGGIPAEQMKD